MIGIRTLVGHPYKPHLIGKNLMLLKDKKGKLFFAELCKAKPGGLKENWVDYFWPKGADNTPYRKIAYVKSGKVYSVTAGVYSDDLTLDEVKKLIK